jgi:hypothetical protein
VVFVCPFAHSSGYKKDSTLKCIVLESDSEALADEDIQDASMRDFDIFISYSTTDKAVADAACAACESDGIRSCTAPREGFVDLTGNGRQRAHLLRSKAILAFSKLAVLSERSLRTV